MVADVMRLIVMLVLDWQEVMKSRSKWLLFGIYSIFSTCVAIKTVIYFGCTCGVVEIPSVKVHICHLQTVINRTDLSIKKKKKKKKKKNLKKKKKLQRKIKR
eukprot:TRINITY_DN2418_c0_g1_i3.p2 TRINITY_DN2418_c0_g1~~TRINITY_DN2418_c0_g1_i3.p2  ORF type:complete len:102 (-),score=20.60 TRINITY_DN2418_c0_g1_i3:65-370(-)